MIKIIAKVNTQDTKKNKASDIKNYGDESNLKVIVNK